MFAQRAVKISKSNVYKIFSQNLNRKLVNENVACSVFRSHFHSDQRKQQEKSQTDVARTDEGHYVERHEGAPSKPRTNIPFVKELFLGRFDKVSRTT